MNKERQNKFRSYSLFIRISTPTLHTQMQIQIGGVKVVQRPEFAPLWITRKLFEEYGSSLEERIT
jgi:hypothetical protein